MRRLFLRPRNNFLQSVRNPIPILTTGTKSVFNSLRNMWTYNNLRDLRHRVVSRLVYIKSEMKIHLSSTLIRWPVLFIFNWNPFECFVNWFLNQTLLIPFHLTWFLELKVTDPAEWHFLQTQDSIWHPFAYYSVHLSVLQRFFNNISSHKRIWIEEIVTQSTMQIHAIF